MSSGNLCTVLAIVCGARQQVPGEGWRGRVRAPRDDMTAGGGGRPWPWARQWRRKAAGMGGATLDSYVWHRRHLSLSLGPTATHGILFKFLNLAVQDQLCDLIIKRPSVHINAVSSKTKEKNVMEWAHKLIHWIRKTKRQMIICIRSSYCNIFL